MLCYLDVPVTANILGRRFVLAFKENGINLEMWKHDPMYKGMKIFAKLSIVQEISEACNYSTRMLLGVSDVLRFQIRSTHVDQSNMESAERLQCDIFMNISGAFEFGPEKL